MNPRIMALTIPLITLAAAATFAVLIPFAVIAMLVTLVKPSIAASFQQRAQKVMVKKMFSTMIKGSMQHG